MDVEQSRRSAATRPRSHSWAGSDPGALTPAGRICEEPAWGSGVWRRGQGCGREGTSILERVTGVRNAEGAGSLPGLPESQSPSRDPSREGRPGRVGGRWEGRAGRRLPHRRLREAPLTRFLAPPAGAATPGAGAREGQRDGGAERQRRPQRPSPPRDPSGKGVRPRCPALRAAPPVALREEAVSVRGALCLFSPELGTRRSCSHVFRRPARLSVCPPTASCVLRPGLPGPRVLRGAMRNAAGPGRTG